ncbi:MAG: ATP-binding cassette domain-containing protein [Pseudonocardiales bacterium]
MATLRGVRKAVGSGSGRRTLLDGVDLDLDVGLTAIIGRSGCGKSTLLHLLGGLEPVDEGAIEVAGVRVDGASASQLVELRRRGVPLPESRIRTSMAVEEVRRGRAESGRRRFTRIP